MLNIMKSTEFYISSADKMNTDRWGQPTKNSGNMSNGIEMRPLGFLYASVNQSGCWRSWQSGRMMEPSLKNELQPKIFSWEKAAGKGKPACTEHAKWQVSWSCPTPQKTQVLPQFSPGKAEQSGHQLVMGWGRRRAGYKGTTQQPWLPSWCLIKFWAS